jgi:hypothetical protein
MRIIRAGDCRTTSWKNGGGSTTEIAAGPDGASLETFDWRVSMARVGSDGPFSDFPGIDRSLAVIKGTGMILSIGSNAPVMLSPGTEPVSFAGDTPTDARLTDGEITDLNVMTRRGCFSHRLQRVTEQRLRDFGDDDIAIVLSIGGKTTVMAEQDKKILDNGDAVVIHRTAVAGFKIVSAASDAYLILLREHYAR